MERESLRGLTGGVNQRGVRDHNERLVLSTIQRHAALPGSDIARMVGLTPQTVSVILRRLEGDGLLGRGDPIRGAVGKPRVPMALSPEGVLSLGVKIGRRTSDVILLDFAGEIRDARQLSYRWPEPEPVFDFLTRAIPEITAQLDPAQQARLAGIGIATPFELWNWHGSVGAPREALAGWRDVDFVARLGEISDLPILADNDATAACRAEQIFGWGRELRDYAYFYLGAFIGGGLVLNHSVYEGRFGNAGAFGPLPSMRPDGTLGTLIETASLYLLEEQVVAAGGGSDVLWQTPLDWSGIGTELGRWMDHAAPSMARAIVAIAAVLDMEAVVIDGSLPDEVRHDLTAQVARHLAGLDTSGISVPRVLAGQVGRQARAIGAASKPIQNAFLLNTHGVTETA